MRLHLRRRVPAILIVGMCFAAGAPAAEVLHGGDTQWIEDAGGAIVRDAAGKITGVDLRASWVTDTDLRKLLRLPDLTHLDLSLTRITDQGMQEIKNLPGIVDLNLYFAEYVTDEGLAAIKGWKRLKRLNVHGTKISDTTLEHISGITTLEQLNIGSAMITDVGLERLTTLPNLKELTMGGNELGDAGLQALRQMPGLTYLDLSGRQGTDSNVWAIAMSDTGLEAVLSLKNLRDLRFGCTFVGVGVEAARFATVSAMNVTTRWLEQMKSLPKLENLKVQGCLKVDDESLAVLAAFPALRELDLKGTSVTEKGLAMFRAAKPKAVIYTGPWDGRSAAFRNN
jgi:Leucine rich repeat/Leucine Rich repeat